MTLALKTTSPRPNTMRKFLASLAMAALAFCAPKTATAQPVFTGRPAVVPLFLTQTAVQTTNTATAGQQGSTPFIVSADHNVNFQFDLYCTNGLGTSNATVVLDTCLDAQQAPGSWKLASYIQNVLTPTSNSIAPTTFQFTLSNVPAFYMRVNQLGSAASNVVFFTNFYYWPFP